MVKGWEEKCEKYKKRLDDYNGLRNEVELKAHKYELVSRKVKGVGRGEGVEGLAL